MQEKGKGFHILYVWALINAALIYLQPVIFAVVNQNARKREEHSKQLTTTAAAFLPLILLLINIIVVLILKNKTDRNVFLGCAVLMKYALIPYYILGGLAIILCILLIFTPIVIWIFVGPTLAAIMAVTGWLGIVAGSPFSIAYITKSVKEKKLPRSVAGIAILLQFFFTVDVFSVMALALKEKRWVKLTIALLVLLILAIICVGLFIVGAILKTVV